MVDSTTLKDAELDDVQLCVAVETRFLDLLASHQRIKKVQLAVPKDLNTDMILWRTMAIRFQSGDGRCSVDEMNALKRVAQWTVDENKKMRNQPEAKDLVWKNE